jgi:hypothetical protein
VVIKTAALMAAANRGDGTMATDWSNVAGLGLLFRFPDAMVPVTVVESCLHPEREGNAYCPKCGVKVGSREVRQKDRVESAADALRDALPRGYEMRDLDYMGQGATGDVFVGYAMITTREDGPCAETRPVPDIAEVERTVTALLAPYDVEVVKPFGLFLCQCVS